MYGAKKEAEREHLKIFLKAYSLATNEVIVNIVDSETPDFIGEDESGNLVGIEITELRFSPDIRFGRRIFHPEPHDPEAYWQLLKLMHQKEQKLTLGLWQTCTRKILAIMVVDTTISELALGEDTDVPSRNGFDEVWLADCTQIEAFGAVDLFAVVHATLSGYFHTGDDGRKPFG